MSRNRNYVFTLNNYNESDETILSLIECKYMLYGREVAPTSGTKHLQGFIVFSNAKSLSAVRRILRGCHIEIARGSAAQCIAYCKKEGDFVERGEIPRDRSTCGDLEKERWNQAWESAKRGDIEDIPADIRIRCYSTIKRIKRDYQKSLQPMDHMAGIWIHGEAGCGKTRKVFETYPELYPKSINKWWCGYQGEEVVLLDDIEPSHGSWIGYFLKIWGDRYPFIGEEKGGSGKIRPKKIIVTSQYTIEQIWSDEETKAALLRRFIVVKKTINQDIII